MIPNKCLLWTPDDGRPRGWSFDLKTMKQTSYFIAAMMLTAFGCGRQDSTAIKPHAQTNGDFVSWDNNQWRAWLSESGFNEIITKDEGVVCDMMARSPDGRQIIMNFLESGKLKDIMFAHIISDLSVTGKMQSAKSCLNMADSLDMALGNSFREIMNTDYEAAFTMNTRKYPWRTTPYVLGITTANKFWMELNQQ